MRIITTPPQPLARNPSVPRQLVVASLAAVVRRQEDRHLAGSERTTMPLLVSAAVLAPAPAFLEAQASLHLVAAQQPTSVVDCSAVEAAVDLAPPTPQEEALVVVRLVVLAQPRATLPTTVPRVPPFKHTPRRMVHPRPSTTRPSLSSSHTQTTLLKS